MGFREARVKAGLSVEDVKKALGVSDVAIYYWESGQNIPTGKRLPEIAKLYGCTVDELLTKEN